MSGETIDRPDAIPWERRSAMDLEKAFAGTVAAFLHPRKAWERTPERGGFTGPLLFAATCAGVGALFKATYDFLIFQWVLRRRPSLRLRTLPWITGRSL